VREADWQVSAELRELVRAALAKLPQFIKVTRTYVKGRDGEPDRETVTVQHDLLAMLKALELASKLQRLAAEVPPPVARHDVTSGDEPLKLIVKWGNEVDDGDENDRLA
jgi:hypothetical protein